MRKTEQEKEFIKKLKQVLDIFGEKKMYKASEIIFKIFKEELNNTFPHDKSWGIQ